ncbi:cytochrome P450 [Daldinia decipiens]|uniref:cytochrome P450 n=1 Tax=Daldinia decipiens TaxID=326647 RepID=UPI0020C3943C|nr:cytochrome P450 [Daldinia decipiens]KAI1657937.1 cytochrome P450 [Daldinia decipiens]
MESSYVEAVMIAVAKDARFAILGITVFLFISWRLFTFTIVPLLHPNDPKEYPYWIPVVGHLRSFFKNSSQLLSEARLYFHNSREPFALTAGGQKWYVLTKAEDVAATYKIDNGSLSYDIFAVEVMRMVGISEEGIRKAFQTQGAEKDNHISKPHKHLVRLCREYQLEQLSPGSRLDRLVGMAIDTMKLHMDVEMIAQQKWYASSICDGCITVSLYQWLSDVFIDMGTQLYFGKLLKEIEPDIVRIFMAFETLSWQAMYQYPSFLCGEMMSAKSKLQNGLKTYFAIPKEQRNNTSWFISQIEKDMDRLNVATNDRAIFFFQLFWSINGNTRKAPFWLLSYLIFDQDLMKLIQAETRPALQNNGVDIAYLLDSQTCPRLNSIWDEMTRLTAFAASVRFLTRDIELGGKILRKGNRLMMPQRQLHFSEQVFGDDASKFNPDRFLKNPALRRNPSLRPFGGGATMCPGRNLAKQTTFAFVAIAINVFDLALDPPGQKFPEAAEGKPSIGLVDLQDGHDLLVRLCPTKAYFGLRGS